MKILLLADAHLPYKHNPVTLKLQAPDFKLDKTIYQGLGKTKQRFLLSLEKAKQFQPFNLIICGGDMVHGYKNQGLVLSECEKGIQELKNIFSIYFPNTPIRYISGNHELGYTLPLTASQKGSPTKESIVSFEKHFNPLFFSEIIADIQFIFLSSDLELCEPEFEYGQSKKEEQRSFLAEQMKKNLKKIIFIHDPDALQMLLPMIQPYMNNIQATFSGHHHAVWAEKAHRMLNYLSGNPITQKPLTWLSNLIFRKKSPKVIMYLQQNSTIQKIWNAMKLTTIPSPEGITTLGGGGLILELKNKEIKTQKFYTPELSYISKIKEK